MAVGTVTVDIKQEILDDVKKYLDFPGLAAELINGALKKELDALVASTATPFDDIALAALYPTAASLINQAIASAWAQLLSPAPAAPVAPASPGGLGPEVKGEVLGAPV